MSSAAFDNIEQEKQAALFQAASNRLGCFPPALDQTDIHSITFPAMSVLGRNVHLTLERTEINRRINQAINAFRAVGVQQGDLISILLPSIPQAYISLWAAQRIATAHPLQPNSSAKNVAAVLAAAKPRILVTLAPLPGVDVWDKSISAIRSTPSIETVFGVDLRHHLPPLQRAITSIYLWKNRLLKQPVPNVQTINFDQYVDSQPVTDVTI